MNWHNVILRPQNLYEEILRRKLISGGGVPAVLQTITGISPLTLLNVASKGIKSLTQFGKCEQASTPTPSVPVDIKCNNGKLGIISDGVPIEYIRIEYLQSSGTQYIDTGVAINYATQKIEQRATVQYTTSNTNRELMGSNGYGFWGKSADNKLESVTGSSVQITESALVKNTVSLITDPNNNNQVTFIVNSHRYDASASTLANNDYACYVFALGGRSGVAASFFCKAKVYEYTIILDNVVVSHLIPVKRRSDGVLGMYDTVTNSFKVNAGTGTFTAGNAIGSIGAIGTPEVLTVVSETTQTASVENLFGVGDCKDEQEIISGAVTHKVGLWVLNGQELWELNSVYGKTDNAFLSRNVVPFAQNSKTLLCTHFVNKESVETSGNVSAGVFAGSQISFFCGKNSNINSVDAWKTWLAAQYANGTPVVIVYPLAETTTEQVTAQHLRARDTATITAQTNNISDISLEIEYWQKAE